MKHFTPLEAARLWKAAEGKSGLGPAATRRAQFLFSESISDSDLLTQLQPAIRTTLLARRATIQTSSEAWTSKVTLDRIGVDVEYRMFGFNQDNIPRYNNGDVFIPGTLPTIKNREPYPQIAMQASGRKTQTNTVGEAFGIDWEAIVNSRGGDINIVAEAINEFAKHSRQTEDALPVKNLIMPSGINTAKLGPAAGGVGVGHAYAGNKAPSEMTLLDIQAAIQQSQAFMIENEPIAASSYVLVTAPANVPIFTQLLSTRELIAPSAGADAEVYRPEFKRVDLGAAISVSANKWLQVLNPAVGANAWFLIPTGLDRPGITRNYLEGYENPQYFLRDTNSKLITPGSLGGGTPTPWDEGDYDSEGVTTKVRWAFDTDTLWNEGIIYSKGDGSAVA